MHRIRLNIVNAVTVALAGMLVAAAAGCESPEEAEARLIPFVEHTPLALDPTETVEIDRWWTNGREMLRLDADGQYALYGDQNRYHTPRERGRWARTSYAVLQLEPYTSAAPESVRVQLARADGRVELTRPGLRPMRAIDAAPPAPEDRLLGTWRGPRGELEVRGDGRFVYRPTHDTSSPAAITRHLGAWTLEDDVLALVPDSPSVASRRLDVTVDARTRPVVVRLRDEGDLMERGESD